MPSVSEHAQRKIFVSNVYVELNPYKLLEFFAKFGGIEERPLGLDKQTRKPKGLALFVYKSIESARRALKVPHKNLEGHTLNCQKAINGPKPNNPFHHHHYQHQPHYPSRKDKSKNPSNATGPGHQPAPSSVASALNLTLGQALTALLASAGVGLGLTNLLGGLGCAPVNQAMQWRVLMEITVLGAMEVSRECRAGTKIHKWARILEGLNRVGIHIWATR